MELNEIVSKVTDPYERQARLYPALLAFFPVISLLSLLYGPKLSVVSNIVMYAISCGGLYLLTNICREFGKRIEPKLFKKWGGKPSTQLLRHRDSTIETITKNRYHDFLSKNINVSFPNPEQERLNPVAADEIYQSAVRWLLNHTRDTKRFSILFQENISYGFRRNALGMKPLALMICFINIFLILFEQYVFTIDSSGFFTNMNILKALPERAVLSLTVSFMMMITWLLFFNKTSVRTAAFSYAETLLRACDELNVK